MKSRAHSSKPRRLPPHQIGAAGLPRKHSPLALFAVLATLLITLSISGCVGLTSAGTPAKKSSNNTAAGNLATSATHFTFGNVATGSKRSQALTLTNTGAAALVLSQARISGAGFSVGGGLPPISIAAGQSRTYHIQFAPESNGNISGTLVFTNDSSDSELSVSLSGTGMTGLSIATQPDSQSVIAGQSATFNVAASGAGAPTYQWRKNGIAIGGATSSIYTTPPTMASDNGTSFSVTVSDGTDIVASNPVILTVTAAPVAPSITTQPASQTVTAGQAATFAVSATGSAPLAYQWSKNGIAISGATSSAYTASGTAASDNGASFTATVTNSIGNATSSAAKLTVNAPPAITMQPTSQGVTASQTATFTVSATGSGTLTYQWNKNGVAIGGATFASYTTPATIVSDNGAQFTVTVGSAAGNITSNSAALTVTAAPVAPSITTQPASQTIAVGRTATFSVSATGSGTLAYQWNRNGAAIGGATSVSYTTPATTVGDSGAQFAVTVTNAVGNMTSNPAALTVSAATSLLNASTASLSFASVNVGSNSSSGVTFTNAGNSNVTVSGVSIAGAGFSASGVTTGQILTPGQTATLNVTFTPAAAAAVTGSIAVASDASNSPDTVTVSGRGIQQVSHSATLTWTASTSSVSGYNIYRSSVSGGPYTKLNSSLVAATQYTDSAVLAGQTYFDVVTSVDSSNAESGFSNEVSATIPAQ